jgi:hypothetical protein
MRIRTIKPEFFNHEGIYDAEHETKLPLRLAFIGLWCAADREGRFKWEPRRLKTQIMPYDSCDFSRVLDALATRAFIVRYASDTGDFGCIPSFGKHQVINNRERPSELPDPCDCNVFDASATREARVRHAGKAEGKGKEGNKEGKGREQGTSDDYALPFDSVDFVTFWSNWKQHLKEKKKPLGETARKQQLAKLKEMGEHRAIAALKHSMENNWQGIFEPNQAQARNQPSTHATRNPRDAHEQYEIPEL